MVVAHSYSRNLQKRTLKKLPKHGYICNCRSMATQETHVTMCLLEVPFMMLRQSVFTMSLAYSANVLTLFYHSCNHVATLL